MVRMVELVEKDWKRKSRVFAAIEILFGIAASFTGLYFLMSDVWLGMLGIVVGLGLVFGAYSTAAIVNEGNV